ncbi:MAG: phosphotransferase [Metamycoplasmataceae bacterium]
MNYPKENDIEEIKKFFYEKLPNLKNKKIISVEKIEAGFTNNIFKLILETGERFKIRKAIYNKFINRQLEKTIEFSLYKKIIFFWDENGDYIKKWIEGETLKKANICYDFWKDIFYQISNMQKIDIKDLNIKKLEYFVEDHKVDTRLKEAFKYYENIIKEEINEDNLVLTHNDVSQNNIIVSDNKFYLIDFEWATLNHNYWDMGNIIKDLEINKEEIEEEVFFNDFDKEKLFKIIFCTHFYTYFWTHKVPNTKRIEQYREEVINRTLYWLTIIKK